MVATSVILHRGFVNATLELSRNLKKSCRWLNQLSNYCSRLYFSSRLSHPRSSNEAEVATKEARFTLS